MVLIILNNLLYENMITYNMLWLALLKMFPERNSFHYIDSPRAGGEWINEFIAGLNLEEITDSNQWPVGLVYSKLPCSADFETQHKSTIHLFHI